MIHLLYAYIYIRLACCPLEFISIALLLNDFFCPEREKLINKQTQEPPICSTPENCPCKSLAGQVWRDFYRSFGATRVVYTIKREAKIIILL